MEGFLWCAILLGLGISGLWGTLECALRTEEDDTADFSLNFCEPDKKALYILSICNLIFGAFLLILLICKNCLFCNNLRAFGIRYHQHGRYAYMEYKAGARETPRLDQLPASEPLYIFTSHGFEQVDARTATSPSAPPMEGSQTREMQRRRDNDYDNSRHGRRPYRHGDDRRPHDRDRHEDRPRDRGGNDDRRPRDGNQRGRRPERGRHGHRGARGRERNGHRDIHPRDRDRDEATSNRPERNDDENRNKSDVDNTGSVAEDSPPSYDEAVKKLKNDDV